jgi:hypothetical protein
MRSAARLQVMRLRWLLFLLLLTGCKGNSQPVTRAAGSYPGQFHIESVDGKEDPALIKANEIKGNLELYLTQNKFKLDMASFHQDFSIEGKWTADKTRVTLTSDKFDFKNPSEEDQKALKLKILQPDQIRAVFGHPVVLETSADRRRLTGLKTTLGNLLGRFEFERPIPH